jgi:hypothetical protein
MLGSPAGTDSVLVAYRLSADREAGLKGDGVVSGLWSEWGSNRDQVLLSVKCCGWQRDSAAFAAAADAELVVRAAYGEKGAYLYCEVTDDEWVHAETGWVRDALDMYVDRLSLATLRSLDPSDAYMMPGQWTVTKSYAQMAVPVAGGALDSLSYNAYTSRWGHLSETMVGLGSGDGGPFVDIVELGPNRRAIEWHIPWSLYGNGGMAAPSEGQRAALVIGYNDADGHTKRAPDALRWKNRSDPWKRCPDPADPKAMSPCDSWGEIEFGPAFEGGAVAVAADVARG